MNEDKSNAFIWECAYFALYLRNNATNIMTMKKTFLSFALFTLLAGGVSAQVANVNPRPQTVNSTGKLFTAPKEWRVYSTYALATSYAMDALEEIGVARAKGGRGTFRVTLGLTTDKENAKYRQLVPNHPDAYYLSVTQKEVVIIGRDERGLYYGVQTLREMMAKGQMEECTVQDWPDVAFRGAIEGFYGRPWSHEHRLRQLDFYGRNKMNVYIYGPKDDPYHRQHWRDPYPEKEARQLRELVDRAHARGVNFYWAIHPGGDIRWTTEDRDNLVKKLEKMYDLGIRSFAVFFDDIAGEGARGEKQAELLNYVDSVFVKKHGDIAPLLLCPTIYNRAWSGPGDKYLNALGSSLRPGIEVMWTGNTVVHTIDKESMDWINSRIKRKGYIWLNFPVNDFVRDHILLGPTYGNGLDIAGDVSGFVSNPMQYAESSKIALYSIADYTWNMKHYDWASSWDRALVDLLPNETAALRVFASYNEDLGPNGHGFRRDESRNIKPLCDRIEKGDVTAIPDLRVRCTELATACDLLLNNKENKWLIEELRPWLVQGKLLAQYGEAVCDAAQTRVENEQSLQSFPQLYRRAMSLQKQMYDNEVNPALLHEYQTGTKLGTLRLLPTINRVLADATKNYNAQHATHFEVVTQYSPFTIESTVSQLAQQPITTYGGEVKISPSNEVITWAPGSQFTVRGDRPFTLRGMDFNFGKPGAAAAFRLECQLPDGTWREVALLHYKDTDPVIHTGNELGGLRVKAFRITNKSGQEQQLYFRHFKFVKD